MMMMMMMMKVMMMITTLYAALTHSVALNALFSHRFASHCWFTTLTFTPKRLLLLFAVIRPDLVRVSSYTG